MSTRTEEPVAVPGAIMSVVVAGFGLAVLFGAPLSPEQVGGCVTFAGAAMALVTVIQRSKVTPNSAVAERVDGDHVIAGEANDRVPEGDVVREVDIPRRAFPEGSPTS